jgi:hypothetical protein
MEVIFITYFIVALALIGVLFFTGRLLLRLLKIGSMPLFTGIFTSLLIGCTLLVLLTSLIYTKCITVNLLFIPLLIGLTLSYWRKKINESTESSLHPPPFYLIWLLLGGFFIFLFRFGHVFNSDANIPLVPHGDLVYYANCIDFLIFFGKENSSVDYVYGAYSGTSPYHFYELWYGAGIGELAGLNTALCLMLVTFSTSVFIIWMGLCAIMEHFRGRLMWTDVLFCFFLLGLTGIFIGIYSRVPFMGNIGVFVKNALNYPKLFPIYFYLIAAFLSFLKKMNFQAICCLLALPIAFVSTAIGVFASILLWLISQYLIVKKINIPSLILTLITLFSLIAFYGPFTVQMNTHVNVDSTNVFYNLTNPSFLRTAFNIVAGTCIQIGLLFFPFFILYIASYSFPKRMNFLTNSLFQLLIFAYFSSLIAWALLHDKLSVVQVFSNLSIPFLNIASSFLLMQVWMVVAQRRLILKSLIAVLLIIGIFQSFYSYRFLYPQDMSYLKQVLIYSKQFSRVGAFLFDEVDYKNIGFSYVSNFIIQGNYLIYSQHKTFPLSISPHDYPYSKEPFYAKIERESIKNTPFYKYVEEEKMKNKFHSINESQLEFIKRMNINYIICTRNVMLPEVLKHHVKLKIIDSHTGEQFYLLNRF